MEIYKYEQRKRYLDNHSNAHLFSVSIEEWIEVHEYTCGEWIIQEGMRPDYLFYVVEGRAKIYVTYQNGKVSLINFIYTNDYFGEMELLNEQYYTKGIQALTRTVCLAFPVRRCRQQLLEDPIFLRGLAKFLSEKATKMATKSAQSLTFPLEHRLADFILQTSDAGIYQEKHITVCDFLGVSYRHLLYVFAQFCDKGYLQKEGRYYRIQQYDALSELADMLGNI